jgi:uncharacterized membrane protein HdeD (DUF308 family)
MPNGIAVSRSLYGDLSINWGWLLALGIIQLVLGIIGLAMTVTLTLATILVYGIFLLVAGVAQLVHSFYAKGWRSVLLHVAIAALYVITGLVIIYNPVLASLAVTLFIGFLFTFTGVIRGIMAFQMKNSKSWGWYLLSAAVSIILGLIIVAQWPVSALWVIGLFVAVELIFNGWASIMIALAAHDLSKSESVKLHV